MTRKPPPRPTEAELSILRILWQTGPGTVRQVYGRLARERPIGYTTALKLMQIMTEKGLLERDTSQRTHIYRPALAEDRTQRQLVKDLIERAFGGSARKLVLQALSAKKASAEEIAEVCKLLDRLEGGST